MGDICGDNRFEVIERAKKDIIESTNIESREEEMEMLDDFLFRCWQMGWLDKYDDTKVNRLKLVQEAISTVMNQCNSDTNEDKIARNIARFMQNAVDGSFPDFETIERCEGCKYAKRIQANGEWWFTGCKHKPYRGKWIVEIEECPKGE